MLALYFSLLVNTCYFLADVFIKLSSLQVSAARLIFIRSIYTVILSFLWIILSNEIQAIPDLLTLLQLLCCGLLNAYGLFAFIKALDKMHFANVSVIGISGALIHYGLGYWINHDALNRWFYFSSLLCIMGIVLQWKQQQRNEGLLWSVSSAIAWGFGYAGLAFPLKHCSEKWATFSSEAVLLLFALGLIWFSQQQKESVKMSLKSHLQLFAIAFFTIVGSLLLNLCYTRFQLSTMGLMNLLFFPYSLVSGYLVFKEKLSKREWMGIGCVFVGILIFYLQVAD